MAGRQEKKRSKKVKKRGQNNVEYKELDV